VAVAAVHIKANWGVLARSVSLLFKPGGAGMRVPVVVVVPQVLGLIAGLHVGRMQVGRMHAGFLHACFMHAVSRYRRPAELKRQEGDQKKREPMAHTADSSSGRWFQ
jgi:hypothetical protein